MLFYYGVRLNTNLILDVNCLNIPVVTGEYNGQPQQEYFPWYYFPVVTPTADHPIVKNLDAIKCEFVSTIDTVGKEEIKKTVLLTTSKYSRTLNTPCRVSLDIMMERPDERFFSKPPQPIAILLEGKFNSAFRDNLSPEITQDKAKYDFRAQSPDNAMIVVSDGDMVINQLRGLKGDYYPLGYNQYTNQWFGNKDFVLNAVDFLCDSSNLISVRSRELKIRLLDKNRVTKNRIGIQVLNTALPVGIVLIFGLIWIIVRKRKFAIQPSHHSSHLKQIFSSFFKKKMPPDTEK
jgi:ABC-2 type transport system permease protein